MSFRRRLTLFFLAIVVVPMVAVAALVVRITDDSRRGKADARLAAGLETAEVTYERAVLGAPADARRIARSTVPTGGSQTVAETLAAGDRKTLRAVAEREVADRDIAAVAFLAPDGELLARAGPRRALAVSRQPVEVDGEPAGTIEVAALDPGVWARQVAGLTGDGAVVLDDDGVLAATVEVGDAELPDGGAGVDLVLGGQEVRAASIPLGGSPAAARLVLVVDQEEGFVASQPVVAAVLLAFFALAFLFIVLLIRMLQGQVKTMLGAAERIGEGDFSVEVPAEGNDEMAGLARQFNRMSDRLAEQMGELRRQREELERSVRRIGEASAAGLDRQALLEIVLETALTASNAESGRIVIWDGTETEAAAGKDPAGALDAAMRRAAGDAREGNVAAEATSEGAIALAHPLRGGSESPRSFGAIVLARAGRPFEPNERELLDYLAGQAAVSVENIGLHERVSQQAVTDELTGLANNRHFREWIEREAERIGRFGGELSLVILDIDDFKRVNDTFGHLQGDAVLEAIGYVLRLESRGIDEAARYGGEEFVVALPETPKDGALEVAERIRERIEATEVAGVGENPPLRVTASLGVATLPADGKDPRGLLAAADEALYSAKRSGKNRVVAAGAG